MFSTWSINDQTWETLKTGLHKIQMKVTERVSFEELYRICFQMVIHGHGEELYNRIGESVSQHLNRMVRNDVADSLKSKMFLSTLNIAFSDHREAMEVISAVAFHLDRGCYVSGENVSRVYPLGIKIFRDEIIYEPTICKHLKKILLADALRERKGEVVDRRSIRGACAMLLSLGSDVYEDIFEKEFLKQSADFFRVECEKLLANSSLSVYIKKVEIMFEQERERARCCFKSSTERRIFAFLEEEFIEKRTKKIAKTESSGIFLIQEDELQRIINALRIHVSKCYGQQGNAPVKIEKREFTVNFIQKLLDLYDRIDAFRKKNFPCSLVFNKLIYCYVACLINSKSKLAEYLALFIDSKLRKTTKRLSDEDTEVVLSKTIVLFGYLQDKDDFKQCYKQQLALRLLGNKFVSYDSEKNMIAKLRNECGWMFTYAIERMLEDVENSASDNSEFRKYIQDTAASLNGVDLRVRVLTWSYWPVARATNVKFQIPAVPGNAFDVFQQFYLAKFDGRMLALQRQMGTADLFATFYGPNCLQTSVDTAVVDREDHELLLSKGKASGRRYILRVTTLQMVILLLFNDGNKWSLEEIQRETNIPAKELSRGLEALTCGEQKLGVLLKKTEEGIDKNHVFTVNDAFVPKRDKIRIEMAAAKRTESKQEQRETAAAKAEGNWGHEIEAAILGIMETRKNLQRSLLLTEVINELKHRFVPNPVIVKTHIKSLLDGGYLKKSHSDEYIYEYIPRTDFLHTRDYFLRHM